MIAFIRGIRTPLRMTWMLASATTSNRVGYFPSRSWIGNRAELLVSSKSVTRFPEAWTTQDAGRVRGGTQDPDSAAGVLDDREYVKRVPFRGEVSKKSQAGRGSACERRKADRVVVVRWDTGLIPASLRICQTVDAATVMPGARSSPWMGRWPQARFSCRAQHRVRTYRQP
ncbi:hypothetical protein Q5530_34430 [Saccharothrix sp. BKS2]|uniref:hypothetical protein n=1 Tax=Saccharothrix sp. BKS2 TaxID=3064400 RepID=UPI0039E8426C